MGLNFNSLRNEPNLISTLSAFEQMLLYNKINCCRVAIVESYDPESRVAKVMIANKLVTTLKDDGAQDAKDYAPIYAKVLFFGWKNIGITHPVLPGAEGLLLFNDREIESWYINGNINNIAHKRAHSKTDAVFIAGLLSLPNMTATLQDFLHFFYDETFLKIGAQDVKLQTTNIEEKCETKLEEFTTKTEKGDIVITGNITQTGNTTIAGTTNSTVLQDATAATGAFTSADGKLVTVVNGIVRTIVG